MGKLEFEGLWYLKGSLFVLLVVMLRDIHQFETFHCSEALNCRHQKEYQKDPDRLIKKSVTGGMFLGF